MTYCNRCILPDTRPGITIDDHGVCTGCRGHDDKASRIDWPARQAAFAGIVEAAQSRNAAYDCIVPVSGGKDSWYQVIKCQQSGLKVLGVSWRTPGRTPIGQRNLDTMIRKLKIDHIDYSINPSVEARFTRAAFEVKGASAIPMHMAIFAIPIRLATKLGIPLIVWGENPQLEFGGTNSDRLQTELDLEWVKKHGVTNNTALQDWVKVNDLTAHELSAYALPDNKEFNGSIRSIFLGSFFPWNSFENASVAHEHGFVFGDVARRTGVWAFADIDCSHIAIHHYLKWFKFGITRAFDNLSQQIRYGMMTRQEAIAELKNIGPQVPNEDIQNFCHFVERDESWFWDTVEKFRNTQIWTRRPDGRWHIPGFLIEDWCW